MRTCGKRGRDLTCLMCKHFNLSEYQRGYSDMTPSSPMEISCMKSHWYFDQHDGTRDDFRAMMLSAQSCEDFEHYEEECET